jgi:colicin import membrane protein
MKEAERQEARRKQLAAERREAEKREAEKREAERRKLSEQKKTEREAKAEEARREQQRQENLRRLQGLAGASSTSGSPGAVGSAARSAGPSAGYAGRIMARIKPNITFTETLTQRQVAEVLVRCAPDGLIISRRIVKSSGNPAWDEAVLKAIDKTERLPRDTDGRVPAEIAMVFNSSE